MAVWLRFLIVILCWFHRLNVACASATEYRSGYECGSISIKLYANQGSLETCEAAARNETNCYGYFHFKSNNGACACCTENTQDEGASSNQYSVYKYTDYMYLDLESESPSDYIEVTLDYDIEEAKIVEIYSNTTAQLGSNWGYEESKLWVTDELSASFYVSLIPASISVLNPKDSSSYKPGDTASIKWAYESGSTNAAAVYLYKSSALVQTLASYVYLSTSVDGSKFNTSVVMPSLDDGLSDGTDYRVKVVDPYDSSFYGYSSYFTISSGILFSDDLCGNSTYWTALSGTWERTDCTYSQTDYKTEGSYAWIGDAITPKSWSDYSVTWTMTLDSLCLTNAGKAGILVRSSGVTGTYQDGNQYFIGVGISKKGKSNIQLKKYDDGKAKTPKWQLIRDGIDTTDQLIKGIVTVEGSKITVNIEFDEIDESYSFSVEDDSFSYGTLGLMASQCKVVFESVTVYDSTWDHYEILAQSEGTECNGAKQASCIDLVQTLIILVSIFLILA